MSLFTTHPVFAHSDLLRQICAPLSEFGVNYFSHVRIHQDTKQFSFLALHPEFIEHYLQQKYYSYDLSTKSLAKTEEWVIWDNLKLEGNTQRMHDNFREFGHGHTFSIITNHNRYRNIYNFAAPFGHTHMNAFYLEHVDLFRLFITYFTEKVNTDKTLAKAYKTDLSLIQTAGQFATTKFDTQINVDAIKPLLQTQRYYINGRDVYLTRRELECLHWIANGKTLEMTAEILHVSPRTVKAHVAHIKEKLGCSNQFQLGMIYSNLNT